MCDFGITESLIAASLVVSAASASASIIGQQQQVAAQQAYQGNLVAANKTQAAQNREIATKAYLDQATQANQALSESRQAAAESNFDTQRQGLEARGAVKAAAAEGGVTGVSLYGLLDDFHRQEAMFKSRNDSNLLMKQQATATSIRSMQTQAEGRIAQIQPYTPSPTQSVDYLGPILGVAQTGINAGMNYKYGANNGSRIRDTSRIF